MTTQTQTTTTKKKYTFAVGRRKAAVAKVKLFSGKGTSTVGSKDASKYFYLTSPEVFYNRPFAVTQTQSKYYFEATLLGGGHKSQLTALTLAIARALVKIDEGNRATLRQSGLLSIDPRVRQRRHVGTGGKARRAKQSPRR